MLRDLLPNACDTLIHNHNQTFIGDNSTVTQPFVVGLPLCSREKRKGYPNEGNL